MGDQFKLATSIKRTQLPVFLSYDDCSRQDSKDIIKHFAVKDNEYQVTVIIMRADQNKQITSKLSILLVNLRGQRPIRCKSRRKHKTLSRTRKKMKLLISRLPQRFFGHVRGLYTFGDLSDSPMTVARKLTMWMTRRKRLLLYLVRRFLAAAAELYLIHQLAR